MVTSLIESFVLGRLLSVQWRDSLRTAKQLAADERSVSKFSSSQELSTFSLFNAVRCTQVAIKKIKLQRGKLAVCKAEDSLRFHRFHRVASGILSAAAASIQTWLAPSVASLSCDLTATFSSSRSSVHAAIREPM